MCIIIHKPAEVAFHENDPVKLEEMLLDARIQNGDGFGIQAWYDGNLVEDYRTVDAKHIDELAKLYFSHPELEVVAHWRFATHGEVVADNCHPFRVHQGMSFFHNGVLTGFGELKAKSDTLDFVERVLQKLIPAEVVELEEHHRLVLDSFADSGQRFVVTNDQGKVWRFGKWFEQDGIWFSNSGLFAPTRRWVFGWAGDAVEDAEYNYGANWENWEREDLRDRDLIWDTKTKQYVKKGLEVIECECFGDVCGEEWHDAVGGCSNRAEYEIKVLEDGEGGKGELLYYVRACSVCADQAGYLGDEGEILYPEECWELYPAKEEREVADDGGDRAEEGSLVLVDGSTGTAMLGRVASVKAAGVEYLPTAAD